MEIIQEKEYCAKVDVWALDVTILSLHFCRWPFTVVFISGDLPCNPFKRYVLEVKPFDKDVNTKVLNKYVPKSPVSLY